MIRSVIVENEKPQIRKLTSLLKKHFPEIEILGIYETIPEAINDVKQLEPDLVFLDIELPPHNGFDLLSATTGINYKVIFTTGYSEYAIKAIKFSALDFLVKPLNEKDLRDAIEKYKENRTLETQARQIELLLKNLKQSEINELEIFLPIKNGRQKLRLGNIICCATQDGKICFYVKGEPPVIISKTLSWAEELLADFRFFRTSDAYLINLSHIEKIEHVRDGALVNLTEGYEAEVSKRKKSKFLELVLQANILKIR